MEPQPPEHLRLPYPVWHWRRASGRLLICIACGLIAGFACPSALRWKLRGVIGWDAGALVLLGLVWPHIATAGPERTRRRAAADDPGRTVVFLIALGASAFSLFAGVAVLRHARSVPGLQSATWTALAILAVALAWLITHTAYTLRYAHLFYRRGGKAGMSFPGTEHPCEMDFAYFAFTIGMCFQVSDVAITSATVRRTALVHALLSFGYNTTILALVLNLVFGFLS